MDHHTASIIVDLGFGDSGKGSIVDFLARQRGAAAVIRFNGGAQAAHNVVTPEGAHHTFSQFGSGTFVRGVRTHLSRFMLVDPLALHEEAFRLEDLGLGNVFARLSVDERAMIVTPFHKAANRLREVLRGDARHGSCGMGIGETMSDAISHPDDTITARHLRDPVMLARHLARVQERKRAEFAPHLDTLRASEHGRENLVFLEDHEMPDATADFMWRTAMHFLITSGDYLKTLAARGNLIFEGAQGVLLDEWYGFHPYTTWSTTTPANADALLREIGYDGGIERLGLFRGYFTRHGAGPFPTEDARLTRMIPDLHNGTGPWQGTFRIGWFDLVLARYALAVAGRIDGLVISGMDRLHGITDRRVCTLYYAGEGKRITRLPVKTELTDLAFQERLTETITKASPLYVGTPTPDDMFFEMIERDLGVPVTIASHGPTAADKRFRASHLIAA